MNREKKTLIYNDLIDLIYHYIVDGLLVQELFQSANMITVVIL